MEKDAVNSMRTWWC